MPSSAPPTTSKRAYLLIPIAVLLVIHPLLIHGPSAGQDLAFHLQSWLDAAAQLRRGTLYPHWDNTAAWNAGEPRFLFYPPISWLLGAFLTLIFPPALCPTIFIAIALLLSGLTFHKLASAFATPNAALIASTLYLANPYMLFTAFERSALAELLAAAWIPLLLLALLRPYSGLLPDPPTKTIRTIAIPLALLWLTNAPAAVIGSYTLALLATLHVCLSLCRLHRSYPCGCLCSCPCPCLSSTISPGNCHSERSEEPASRAQRVRSSLQLALTYLAATLLGLTLPAIYLLPAAHERRNVQTAMALLPNMRYQDNFLFTQTPDPAHNAVNHTISLLALILLLLTTAAVLTLLLKKNPIPKESTHPNDPSAPQIPRTSSLSPFAQDLGAPCLDPETSVRRTPGSTILALSIRHRRRIQLALPLAVLTLTIAFLLIPLSAPIWRHLPNLAYLQFPWRLLTLLTPILALSTALLLDCIPAFSKLSPSAQHPRLHLWMAEEAMPGAPSVRALADGWDADARSTTLTTALAFLLPLTLAIPAYHLYHQLPDPTDDPTHQAQLFRTHHGFPPTDEYTPTAADNDPLRSNNPAYWLAHYPNEPSPNSTPTASELNPTLDTDDTPIPDPQSLSTPAPHHLQIHTPTPSYLILNLRDYPNWQVATTSQLSPSEHDPTHIPRPDGLLTIALPHPGDYTIDITWHRTLDQQLGLALTLLALIALALTYRRKPSA